LIALFSEQEGPLGKTAPFLRVLDEVRFSDAESAQIKTEQVGKRMTFEGPSGDLGRKEVAIEDADAKTVVELIESWPKSRTEDHRWTAPLLKELR
jgi:hypothetical protein